jgi:hypothetical protein
MDLIAEPDMIVRSLLIDVLLVYAVYVPSISTRLGAPVSSDLETLLLACLAKRPHDRPGSAHVLREHLRACATAGRWTNARAAQWWALHRRDLRSGGAGASPASGAARAPHLITRIAD